MRTSLIVVLGAVAVVVAGCDSRTPTAASGASSATTATPAPSASPPAPAQTTTADAPKGSMTSNPTEAGSAMGGTAAGNTVDPSPKTSGGPTSTGRPPEPTGGDGSKEAAKAEPGGSPSK